MKSEDASPSEMESDAPGANRPPVLLPEMSAKDQIPREPRRLLETHDTVDSSFCDEAEKAIEEKIKQGTTRHKKARFVEEVEREIADFAQHGGDARADLLRIILHHQTGQSPFPETTAALRKLLATRNLLPQSRMTTLGLLAKTTLLSVPFEENNRYRREAISIAEQLHLVKDHLALLTNWIFAATTKSEFGLARQLIDEGRPLLAELDLEPEDDLIAREIRVRWPSHEAKVYFAEIRATGHKDPQPALFGQACALYEQAVALAGDADHWRVNLLIEYADQLVEIAAATMPSALPLADKALDEAHRGLDAHQCEVCIGYFHFVSSRAKAERGHFEKRFAPEKARATWQSALVDAENCQAVYQKAGFGGVDEIEAVKRALDTSLSLMNRPRRVFLSHSRHDKPLVRRYKQILGVLGFDVWLDDDAMPAGVKLERSLLKGFEESSAVIFFITPNFKDGLYSRICGSKWRFPAAGRRVRYAWRPAATRAGGSKLVAAARLPAAGKLARLRRVPMVECLRA